QKVKLAQLLTRGGEPDEAAEMWVGLLAAETEPHRNLMALDSLVTAGKQDSALAILARLRARHPGNWELLYREGATLAARGTRDEAAARFRALLATRLSDDELGALTKFQIEQAKKKAASARPKQPAGPAVVSGRYDETRLPPLTRRTQRLDQLR